MQGDGAIAFRPVGALQRQPQQLFQTASITLLRAVLDDGERENARVGRKHVRGTVR